MNSMKILFILGGIPFGGIEVQLQDICLELKRQGHEPIVVNISGTGRKHADFIESGIETIALFSDKAALKTFKPQTITRLRQTIRDVAPDIIHTQQFSADYYGRLAATGINIPVVTHIHNTASETKAHRRIANKLLSLRTDRFLCVSRAVKKYVQKTHNIAGKPVEVLYNCIDEKKFTAPPLNLSEEFDLRGRVVVAVGRLLNHHKNFDKLVEAFAILLSRQPDARLLIVGEGSDRTRLEAQIAKLGLDGKAVLAGYRTDVGAILKSCHLLAMPSAYEGFANVVIEAMECGLPAVLSKHVPALEIASEASLICDTDPKAICGCLDILLSDAARYKKLRDKARSIASDRHVGPYVDDLLHLYRNLSG